MGKFTAGFDVGKSEQRSMQTYGASMAVTSSSGITIGADSALRLASAYRAIWLKSSAVGMLPIKHYKESPNGRNAGQKKEQGKTNIIKVLNKPNPEMNGYIFRQTAHLHYNTRGNAFIQIIRNRKDEVTQLWLLNPDKMAVERQAGKLVYKYYSDHGIVSMPPEEIIHYKNFSMDGIWGLTPAQQCADSMGYGISNMRYGNQFYQKGARISGAIETDGVMEEEDFMKYRDDVNTKYAGMGAEYSLLVLDNGYKFKPVTLSQKDAQFIESAQFSVDDIGRIYGVPSFLLNNYGRATFNNVENLSILFTQYTMLSEIKQWEIEFSQKLFTPEEQDAGNYLELVIEMLLRGDALSRFESYGKGIQWGIYNANEVRAKENLAPRQGGDQYVTPTNMYTNDQLEEIVKKQKLENQKLQDEIDSEDDDDLEGGEKEDE